MRNTKVCVLLATFNGGRYLREQLESLYSQDFDDIAIRVRDDGSTDETETILAAAQAEGRIEWLKGERRLGAGGSFLELLVTTDSDGDFFAFCDQDDVWLPTKVSRAVAALREVGDDVPALYCSRLVYVNEKLEAICTSPPARRTGFGNALVENVAVGCTIVLNRAARLLISRRIPKTVIMHDWWCYLVVACFGRVVFDSWSGVLYRQHASNTIGVALSALDDFRRRWRRFRQSDAGVFRASDQARQFMESFEDSLEPDRRHLLERFVAARCSTLAGIRLSLSQEIWRQSRVDNAILKALILIRKF
jgi:glycosyltransferase involved in cell wall biosynthesis